jgi:putative membrane protein
MTEPEPRSSNELARTRTDLAAGRTMMAADRSLMAWIRTALSMDSFGFTIYKLLTEFAQKGAALPHAETPRNMGLFLCGLGSLSMIMGTLMYWQTLRDLRRLQSYPTWRPTFMMAVLMTVFGLFLFFGIMLRVL